MFNEKEITLEFYFKKAIYNSPITGSKVPIDIKKVFEFAGRDRSTKIAVVSTMGVHYYKEDLSDFSI